MGRLHGVLILLAAGGCRGGAVAPPKSVVEEPGPPTRQSVVLQQMVHASGPESPRRGEVAWVRVAPVTDATCLASFDVRTEDSAPGYVRAGEVFRTDDAGASWRSIGVYEGELLAVQAGPGGELAMARGTNIAGSQGHLYRAESGSGDWVEVPEAEWDSEPPSTRWDHALMRGVWRWSSPSESSWCREQGGAVVAGRNLLEAQAGPNAGVHVKLPEHSAERARVTRVRTAEAGDRCVVSFETDRSAHLFVAERGEWRVGYLGSHVGTLRGLSRSDSGHRVLLEGEQGRLVLAEEDEGWAVRGADAWTGADDVRPPTWCTPMEAGARLGGVPSSGSEGALEVVLDPA